MVDLLCRLPIELPPTERMHTCVLYPHMTLADSLIDLQHLAA